MYWKRWLQVSYSIGSCTVYTLSCYEIQHSLFIKFGTLMVMSLHCKHMKVVASTCGKTQIRDLQAHLRSGMSDAMSQPFGTVQWKQCCQLSNHIKKHCTTCSWSTVKLGTTSRPVLFLLKLEALAARENGFGWLFMRALEPARCG